MPMTWGISWLLVLVVITLKGNYDLRTSGDNLARLRDIVYCGQRALRGGNHATYFASTLKKALLGHEEIGT